ncbi:hypothetical protein [Kutzneria kofuensis]|uniref:Uncharacterized protein n=1 Tax=Kutzneria kofuensis TaxID=103725 RepID=A0A7W9KK33_9PSEU|nr:hypothetical protein [Kutzneria kofuensis]MBB5893763.1 hypothetical protein [Kutzneria kofuensis]
MKNEGRPVAWFADFYWTAYESYVRYIHDIDGEEQDSDVTETLELTP